MIGPPLLKELPQNVSSPPFKRRRESDLDENHLTRQQPNKKSGDAVITTSSDERVPIGGINMAAFEKENTTNKKTRLQQQETDDRRLKDYYGDLGEYIKLYEDEDFIEVFSPTVFQTIEVSTTTSSETSSSSEHLTSASVENSCCSSSFMTANDTISRQTAAVDFVDGLNIMADDHIEYPDMSSDVYAICEEIYTSSELVDNNNGFVCPAELDDSSYEGYHNDKSSANKTDYRLMDHRSIDHDKNTSSNDDHIGIGRTSSSIDSTDDGCSLQTKVMTTNHSARNGGNTSNKSQNNKGVTIAATRWSERLLRSSAAVLNDQTKTENDKRKPPRKKPINETSSSSTTKSVRSSSQRLVSSRHFGNKCNANNSTAKSANDVQNIRRNVENVQNNNINKNIQYQCERIIACSGNSSSSGSSSSDSSAKEIDSNLTNCNVLNNNNNKRNKNGEDYYQDNNLSWLIDFNVSSIFNPSQSSTNANTRKDDRSSQASRKPRLTYTELIEQALKENGQLTVSGIYNWISTRYPYYQQNDDKWKNSVRHNLSINPQFCKGKKASQGAGHYWTTINSGISHKSPTNIISNNNNNINSSPVATVEFDIQKSPTSFSVPDASAGTKSSNESCLILEVVDDIDEEILVATNSIQQYDSKFQINDVNLHQAAEHILSGVKRQVEVQYVNNDDDLNDQNNVSYPWESANEVHHDTYDALSPLLRDIEADTANDITEDETYLIQDIHNSICLGDEFFPDFDCSYNLTTIN